MAIPKAAEGLYAGPPARFVAERNALAQALAARGDPGAAAVRRLRRPTGLAWVMNRLAQEEPDRVRALLAAGDRLRRAQRRALAGEGGTELRAAERDLRERARSLREVAAAVDAGGRPGRAGALARLELLLRVAATAPGEVRDALRRGVLEREPDVATPDLSGLGLLAGGAQEEGERGPPHGAVPDEGGRPRAAPARSGQRTGSEAASARRIEREERARESREAARARRELSRAEGRAARAGRALAAAEARLRRAREAAGAAERAADGARREADAAGREAERRRAAVSRADAGP